MIGTSFFFMGISLAGKWGQKYRSVKAFMAGAFFLISGIIVSVKSGNIVFALVGIVIAVLFYFGGKRYWEDSKKVDALNRKIKKD